MKKKLKIGFFLDNSNLENSYYDKPERGPQGIGYSSFYQVALPYFLNLYHQSNIEVLIIAIYTKKLPPEINSIKCSDIISAAKIAKNNNCDFFVYRSRFAQEKKILEYIDEIKLSSIAIPMISPSTVHIRQMSKSKFLNSIVCVGREQYDFMLDTVLFKKRAYIDLSIYPKYFSNFKKNRKNNTVEVTYLGALVDQKGFHILAKSWSIIRKKHKNIKLNVIGTSQIYGDNIKLGKYNLADEKYEKKFIKYLTDKNGRLFDDVIFHGQKKEERFQILANSDIGVVNPSGQTEWCCVSAVEMAMCKLPIVTGSFYGLLDTIIDKKTGLLGRGHKVLGNNILKLANDIELSRKLGLNGYKRASEKYDFKKNSTKWHDFLFDQFNNNKIVQKFPKRNFFYHFKYLIIFNYFLQKIFGGFIFWPSIEEIKIFLRSKIR